MSIADVGGTTCSGKPYMSTRTALTVTKVSNGTIGSFLLTVMDTDGTPIPGWIGLPMTAGVPLSLVNLTTNLTGATPQYSLLYLNATGSPNVEMSLTYGGPGPELCFTVSVERAPRLI